MRWVDFLSGFERDIEKVFSGDLASEQQRNALKRIFTFVTDADVPTASRELLQVAFPDATDLEKSVIDTLTWKAGATMSGNAFHSPQHAFLVAMMAALFAGHMPAFQSQRRAGFLLMVAGFGHDMDHPGGLAAGFPDFEVEKRSAALTVQVMRSYGMGTADCEFVRSVIISSFAQLRRMIMRLMDFAELEVEGPPVKDPIPTSLPDCFHVDPEVVAASAVLSDADLFFSMAVDFETSCELSRRIMRESRPNWPEQTDQEAASFFIDNVTCGNFATEPGARYISVLREIEGEAGVVLPCPEKQDAPEIVETLRAGARTATKAGRTHFLVPGGREVVSGRAGDWFLRDSPGENLRLVA